MIFLYRTENVSVFVGSAISRFKCPKTSGQQGSAGHLKVCTLKVNITHISTMWVLNNMYALMN
jgi:hypothetical protein